MTPPSFRCAALGALLLGAATIAHAQQPAKAPAKPQALPTETKTWKGDFDGMVERRHLRVLVPYSRTLYYNDHGRERGITADLARDFERYSGTSTRSMRRSSRGGRSRST